MKNLVADLLVIVNGSLLFICSTNFVIADPELPNTLPNLTMLKLFFLLLKL